MTYYKVVNDVCSAVRHLRLFPDDVQMYSYVDIAGRKAWVTDDAQRHIVYVPLFIDYYPDSSPCERRIAQERDIADLIYLHAYVTQYHDVPVHMIGHSRGAATIAVYLGLLQYDPAYLAHLATTFWPVQESWWAWEDVLPRLRMHIGIACFIGIFDNLRETLTHICASMPVPQHLYQAVVASPEQAYQRISSVVPLPHYDWSSTITPRKMVVHIPEAIPCIWVHVEQDCVNPVAAAYDMYATRAAYAPHNTYLCTVANTYWPILPHVPHMEIPYYREDTHVIEQIHACLRGHITA